MNQVDFPHANFTFRKPEEMTDEECSPLRVHLTSVFGLSASISCWEPTEEERKLIAEGGKVWLTVFGRGHPPVSISGVNPFKPVCDPGPMGEPVR